MRIGVVSDTHMPGKAKNLPRTLIEGLQGVDLILHAGDWLTLDVARDLAEIAPVDGVAGNNDGFDIINKFGRKKVLELNGRRIGVVHGDSMNRGTEAAAWEAFQDQQVDVIIFGHSHIPLMKEKEGVLLFNPGSATDKRRQELFSYGILELGDTIHAEHFFYADKS